MTDLETVRLRIWPDEDPTLETPQDAVLEALIEEVSDAIEDIRGAALEEAVRTVYIDGEGGNMLRLPYGPLVSVVSVNSVVYVDDGAGGRTKTLTLIPPYRYVPRGLRSDGHRGLGWLEMLGCHAWCTGRANYEVVFVAGFDEPPLRLRNAATNEVKAEFNTLDLSGLESLQLDNFLARAIQPEKRRAALEAAVRPYM